MSEKITWTHVDRHVRQALERSGTIAFGETDAEVTMGYIAFLERSLKVQQQNGDRTFEELRRTRVELEEVKRRAQPVKKTKQRLAEVEAAVYALQQQIKLLAPTEPACRECMQPAEHGYQFCKDHMRL